MLLQSFFSDIYLPRRLRGKSQGSIRLYRLCILQFSRSIGRPAVITDLSEGNVLLHLSRRSQVAPATRNKELSQLLALWRFANQRGLLATWPDIHSEHEPERAPIAWMPDELEKLLAGASRVEGMIGKTPANVFWQAMIRTILDTGERVGAIRLVKWEWIQNDWLFVPAEARKGKTRDRRYRLSPETLDSLQVLRRYTGCGSDAFRWPYGETYLWNRFKLVLKAAGLPSSRKHQLHCLRKTVASAVYASGGNPQDALDHADRRTTQRYLDARLTRTEAPCDILAAYLANPRKPPVPPATRATG